MIEEAAGTKMYDEKREEAYKEIEKKQRKVDEISRVLIPSQAVRPADTDRLCAMKSIPHWPVSSSNNNSMRNIRRPSGTLTGCSAFALRTTTSQPQTRCPPSMSR